MKPIKILLALLVCSGSASISRKVVALGAAMIYCKTASSQVVTHTWGTCATTKFAIGYAAATGIQPCNSTIFAMADTTIFRIKSYLFQIDTLSSNRSDGDPDNFIWADANGKLKRSPKSSLTIPSGQISGINFANYYTKLETNTLLDFKLFISDTAAMLSPYLRTISFTWTNLSGKPSFATVATTGDYNDLINKPTIPSAQVNSDWNAGSGVAQILNRPDLSLYWLKTDTVPSGSVMTKAAATTAIDTINTKVNGKQSTLVSGTNIKTINSTSLLGSGDISLDGSVLNEGSLTVNAGTGSTSIISSNTSGSTDVTLTAGTGIGISEAGNNITLTSTVVAPGTANFTGYGSGTAYTLTTTPSAVTFGTTSPSITLTTAGTYLILTNIKIEYVGVTNLVAQALTFKLRRTNNTAADLPSSVSTFNVPAITLLTQTAGDCDIPAIVYTTANTNDVVTVFANRGGALSVGSINVGEASVVAVRIY